MSHVVSFRFWRINIISKTFRTFHIVLEENYIAIIIVIELSPSPTLTNFSRARLLIVHIFSFSGLKVLEAHGLNSHTSKDLVHHHLDLTLVSDLTGHPEVFLLTLGLQQDLISPLGRMHLQDLNDPLYLLNNQGIGRNPVLSLAFKQSNQQNLMHHQLPNLKGAPKNKSGQDQNIKKDGASTCPSLTDELLDSVDGFFVQSGPIPQTKDNTSGNTIADKLKEDTTKPSLPTEKPNTTNKNSQKPSSQPAMSKTINVTNGPPQQAKPPQNDKFKPDTPKEAPRGPHVMNQTGPPQVNRGRGRGQVPAPLRGRGRARGRGQMVDPNCQREIMSEDPYDQQLPDDITLGEDQDSAWRDPSLEGPGEMDDQEAPHEMWHPEEEHFPEEYYEISRRGRPPVGHREHPQSTHPDENWEEEPHEYWEEESILDREKTSYAC